MLLGEIGNNNVLRFCWNHGSKTEIMAVITKNMKNTGRMTMDLVADLVINSLRLLEKVFILSLVPSLNSSINNKRPTYPIYRVSSYT